MSILKGIRVLDCTLLQQGPMAATALADLGADVIKIESPQRPDILRGQESFGGVALRRQSPMGELHITFEACNRGKRGIALNLRTERGRELLYKLVECSDVFIHNWSPRVVKDLGIGYETIAARNPRIVYLQSTAFGSEGPYKDMPGLDPLGAGFTGFMYLPSPGASEPAYALGGIGDATAALMSVTAMLGALFARERTGNGGLVEISQVGALLWLMSMPAMAATVAGEQMARAPRERDHNPLFNTYRCHDGKWIVLGELQPERRLVEFYEAIGRSDLMQAARFNSFQAILNNREDLIRLLDDVFSTRDAGEWLSEFQKRGIIAGPVNTAVEAVREPQLTINGYIQEYQNPSYGPVRAVAMPIKLHGQPVPIAGTAPALGQHTEEVLQELCGLSWDDLVSLREAGVI